MSNRTGNMPGRFATVWYDGWRFPGRNPKLFQILTALCLSLIVAAAAACTTGQGGAAPASEAAARPPVAVDVAAVTAVDVEDGIDVVGTLAAKFQAEVKSEYTGIVTAVYVTEWVRVGKGTPLARLDTREIEVMLQKALAAVEAAKAAQLQAEVGANRAERELDRLTKLSGVGLVTRQNLDDARTQHDAARAQVAAAKAQITAAEEDVRHVRTRFDKATILSPMSGVVAFRGVNVGDLAGEMGSPKVMFLIVDNRRLDLTVNVPSWELSRLRPGQTLSFWTDALPGQVFTGRVQQINPSVDNLDRSLRVVAEVPNDKEVLKGGLFVKGRIVTGKRPGVLQVPRIALLGWNMASGQAEVYCVEGNQARRRQVTAGAAAGEFVEITAGLAPGVQVVTRGAFNVRDGDRLLVNGGGGR